MIVAEMIAVKSGLGYVLWDAYYVGRMDICVADDALGRPARLRLRPGDAAAGSHVVLRWRTLEAHA